MKDISKKPGYFIDFVFCIDGTATMAAHIDRVKKTAKAMATDIREVLEARRCVAAQIRVKLIVFRDYLADGEYAMLHTDFLVLPQQNQEFESCLNSIVTEGGADDPEDGLEALAYAIKSKWTTDGLRKRRIIVVWTDADAHELGHGKHSQYYPRGMAKDITELEEWWNMLEEKCFSMMILFAPDKSRWEYISHNWNGVIQYPSLAGEGLDERVYASILSAIHDPA